MSTIAVVAGRSMLLFGAIASGGYAYGTPDAQHFAALLCGLCIGAYVATGVFR